MAIYKTYNTYTTWYTKTTFIERKPKYPQELIDGIYVTDFGFVVQPSKTDKKGFVKHNLAIVETYIKHGLLDYTHNIISLSSQVILLMRDARKNNDEMAYRALNAVLRSINFSRPDYGTNVFTAYANAYGSEACIPFEIWLTFFQVSDWDVTKYMLRNSNINHLARFLKDYYNNGYNGPMAEENLEQLKKRPTFAKDKQILDDMIPHMKKPKTMNQEYYDVDKSVTERKAITWETDLPSEKFLDFNVSEHIINTMNRLGLKYGSYEELYTSLSSQIEEKPEQWTDYLWLVSSLFGIIGWENISQLISGKENKISSEMIVLLSHQDTVFAIQNTINLFFDVLPDEQIVSTFNSGFLMSSYVKEEFIKQFSVRENLGYTIVPKSYLSDLLSV
jgi:hypothetical protein